MARAAWRKIFRWLPAWVLAGCGVGWAGGIPAADGGGVSSPPGVTLLAAPSFSPPGGVYNHDVNVILACATPGAVIHYTVDGSTPDSASPVYDGQPIVVDNHVAGRDDPDPADEYLPLDSISATIRAVAILPGGGSSDVATADYAIDKVDSVFNLPYAEEPPAGGTKHWLDVYRPSGATHTKVLLFIHGGAWKQGDKNIYLELGNVLAGYYGYTTIIANYQLSAEPWNALHPAHVQDVAMAFAWVWRHVAEYGGDPHKIFVFGQSAGGHLVSLLATDDTYLAAEGLDPGWIRAVVSMSGVYALWDLVAFPNNPLDLGAVDVLAYKTLCLNTFGGWDRPLLDAASPASYVRTGQPPFHLIHAWEDMAGFNAEAVNFHAQINGLGDAFADILLLEETDIPPEVLALDLGGHTEEIYAINTRTRDCLSARTVVDFLESSLHYGYDIDGNGLVDQSDRTALGDFLAESTSAPGSRVGPDVNLDSHHTVLDLLLLDRARK